MSGTRATLRAAACAFVAVVVMIATPNAQNPGPPGLWGSASGVTCPGGNVICNGSTNFLSTELFFEPEVGPLSLKQGPPTWNEIEQLLDNPYQVASGAACNDIGGPVPGTDQGYPTYCTPSTFIRRLFFRDPTNLLSTSAALPPMFVHPLNYNPPTGGEMRLLNPSYAGGSFNNAAVCYTLGALCFPPASTITVSSGASRVTQADITYDFSIGRKQRFCQTNPEPVPLNIPMDPINSTDSELYTVCGAEPGEPGGVAEVPPALGGPYHNSQMPDSVGLPSPVPPNVATFVPQCVAYATRVSSEIGVPMSRADAFIACGLYAAAAVQPSNRLPGAGWYSTPAIPGVFVPSQIIPTTARLYDATRGGFIAPRDVAAGTGGLKKPSLRIRYQTALGQVVGSGTQPDFTAAGNNVMPQDATDVQQPSNENDYVGLFGTGTLQQRKENARLEAMVLGKSLFWDQQVGSDAVQACGSCHAHAGADNRTKNQVNPNHLGGDLTFTIPVNTDLTVGVFPLHKLADPEVAGDPNCVTPIVADVTGISFPDGDLPSHPLANPKPTVCSAGNIVSDTNDVASSMGVHFGRFLDIPTPGPTAFTPPAEGGVRSVLPDLRSTVAADNIDPIPGFAGVVCDPTTSLTPCPPGSLLPTDPLANHQFRRVEPRNTPTIFLADFNFDNFWDGRARHDFNGGSVFGPADPQGHVFVSAQNSPTQQLLQTRQIIKFASLASLATGPGLSEFEMSFLGRNWAKIGKKLLQRGVTPLANQLVAPTDGILGRYSNQGGSACATLPAADRSPAGGPPTALGTGVPGLCISYPALIRHAFHSSLSNNTAYHLDGCYTDGRPDIHPNQCGVTEPAAAIATLDADGVVRTHNNDPFDGYVLNVAFGAPVTTDTNQFTQMEGNFSLFWGLSIHLWATILVPDDTPFDQFLDQNPDTAASVGESGETLLVLDLPNCQAGAHRNPPGLSGTATQPNPADGACFSEFGNFKRDATPDPSIPTAGKACVAETTVAGARVCTKYVPALGTRGASDPDPVLGMDLFFGSNLSLKNPEYRSARCGECHAAPTLTDHTLPFTVKAMEPDLLPEFQKRDPTIEPLLEPLGRERVISGFLLESELNDPGQDAIERRVINQSIAPAPVVTNNPNCITDNCSGYAFPDGIVNDGAGGYTVRKDLGYGPLGPGTPVPFTSFGGAFFDNGVYNIGVRPCVANQVAVTGACEDNGRGNTDAFGWPLSLAALMLKDLGGPAQQPGVSIAAFNPRASADCAPYCHGGGLFGDTEHDQQINPGLEDDPINPQLPAYLEPFANKITVGDAHPQVDEACGSVGGCVNTLMDVANAEGFPEIPSDPRNDVSEVLNNSYAPGDATLNGPGAAQMGTWPVVNRVGRFGSFKAPQLREVELTGPYFHNGGKLTLRQVVDFYTRGGDFPVTNSQHRDFNILNLNAELQSNLSENEKVALVDFMLELTDNRVRFEKAPFDHPEAIIPLDGTAPENTGGRFGTYQVATCVSTPNSARFGPGQKECAGGMFLQIPATGAAGNPGGAIPSFLNLTSIRPGKPGFNCSPTSGAISHYCH